MPISSKILKSLAGSADNSVVSAKSVLDDLKIPEKEVADLVNLIGGEHGGFVPQDVEFNLNVDAGGGFGSADDVVKFSVTPEEYWKGYLGGDLFAPFRKRLLERNQPGDPKALFFNKPSHTLENTLTEPVDVFMSPTNRFKGGGAAGVANTDSRQLYMNMGALDGEQNVLGHEITHALGHDRNLLPTEDIEIRSSYDPVLGTQESQIIPADWGKHMRRHSFYAPLNEAEKADTMLQRYLDNTTIPDNQLAAIMSEGPELEEFLFELKQQSKLVYGDDFGIDEAANDEMIDILLNEPPVIPEHPDDLIDPTAVTGGIEGDAVQGFEINKQRFQTMWELATPEQREIMRNGLHRAGAIGGAAVLGGLTDDGS